ncbi:MAG: PIN domain-containing protein [Nanoarchaeota archaeon]
MTDIKALDSSAWLYYLFGQNEECRKIVESDTELVISTISIFEIKRKLIRLRTDRSKIEASLSMIKKRAIVEEVTCDLAEKAAELAHVHNLHATDSLIYATAKKRGAMLVTADSDFKGAPGVMMVD